MQPNLTKGDIVTIISISDWMACTVRQTVYATGETHIVNDVTKPVFKDTKAKRNKFTLRYSLTNAGPGKLVFLNLPLSVLTLDSEAPAEHRNGMSITSFSGNACFNFMQTPLEIQAIIESSNLNKDFAEHDRILSLAADRNAPTLVYPDKYTPGTHAIIDRILTPNLA